MIFRRWEVLAWWVPNGGAGEAEIDYIASRHFTGWGARRRAEYENSKLHSSLINRLWFTAEKRDEYSPV